MFLTDYSANPVAERAAKRRAMWELERLAQLNGNRYAPQCPVCGNRGPCKTCWEVENSK